jgi:hypothetical protein
MSRRCDGGIVGVSGWGECDLGGTGVEGRLLLLGPPETMGVVGVAKEGGSGEGTGGNDGVGGVSRRNRPVKREREGCMISSYPHDKLGQKMELRELEVGDVFCYGADVYVLLHRTMLVDGFCPVWCISLNKFDGLHPIASVRRYGDVRVDVVVSGKG